MVQCIVDVVGPNFVYWTLIVLAVPLLIGPQQLWIFARRHLGELMLRGTIPLSDTMELQLEQDEASPEKQGESIPPSPAELTESGVLWRDEGRRTRFGANIIADGPFCPDDRTPLRYREVRYHKADLRDWVNEDEVGDGYGELVCPECGRQYLLGTEGSRNRRMITTDRLNAQARFEGLSRRQSQADSI